MTTANDIIRDAFLFATIGDQYNPQDATSQNGALGMLNSMIDAYSTQELTIFGYTEGSIPLAVGVSPIQVGPAMGLNVRPPTAEAITIVDTSNVSHPVKIIGVQQWADITYKPAPGRPECVYIDGEAPISNWFLWPLPAMLGDVMHVWYWQQLPQFAALTNTLVAPPGYELFLKTTLGVMLAAMNKKELPATSLRIARSAKADARRLSNQPRVLSLDVPMPSAPWFNVYTGGPL
jgi:hypothetical protein